MSEKQEDKSQRYFPGADARCHSCHAQVFWISRANGPEGPPGLFNADGRLGAGSVVTAYCSRAIADADDRECISGGQLIFSFLAGIGPSRRLAPDFTSNVDWFLGGAPKWSPVSLLPSSAINDLLWYGCFCCQEDVLELLVFYFVDFGEAVVLVVKSVWILWNGDLWKDVDEKFNLLIRFSCVSKCLRTNNFKINKNRAMSDRIIHSFAIKCSREHFAYLILIKERQDWNDPLIGDFWENWLTKKSPISGSRL
jgi:hypothetical protein